MSYRIKNKKGQVWVETVTYTLIALVLIGLILAFAKPKIDELQDKSTIDHSIEMMKKIDSVIIEIFNAGEGNKRKVEVQIKKGDLIINPGENKITFQIESEYEYSEPGIEVASGSFNVLTETRGKGYVVTIEKKYNNIKLNFFEKEEVREITSSEIEQTIYIENRGGIDNIINFEL